MNTETELDEALSRPSSALLSFIKKVSSPLLLLGAGGKMGPTLGLMARRASIETGHPLEVIAVSRFNDPAARDWLERHGIKTIAADLLDVSALKQLPEAMNIIYLAGLKFGTTNSPAMTWAMNTIAPSNVMVRYPKARIVALSTGNVYPFSDVNRGGSIETEPLTPLGEYPNAAVARERIFEFYSRRNGTEVALLRLFYAMELRYGVVADIARKIFARESIRLANGHITCIWQADANEMILRSLGLVQSPPRPMNLCRPEIFSVRQIALRLGELLKVEPIFSGAESSTALLGNAQAAGEALGEPSTSLEQVMVWVADWIRIGGRDLNKPTHFEVRDGQY